MAAIQPIDAWVGIVRGLSDVSLQTEFVAYWKYVLKMCTCVQNANSERELRYILPMNIHMDLIFIK